MAKSGMTTVLARFFGYHEKTTDQAVTGVAAGGIKGFAAEVKALSDSDKLELAQAAAREMGLKQEDATFPLD